LSIRRLRACSSAPPAGEGTDVEPDARTTRRRFLALVVGTAATAVVAGLGARIANAASITADAVRAAITLPKPARAAAPIDAAAALDIDGLAPLITPNEQFYRIDTALRCRVSMR